MTLRTRDEAESDLESAFDWYKSCRRGPGHDFLDEFQVALRAVAEFPKRWALHPHVDGFKRLRLNRFPFALAYRVESDVVMIYAVEDLRRKPGYWLDRLH